MQRQHRLSHAAGSDEQLSEGSADADAGGWPSHYSLSTPDGASSACGPSDLPMDAASAQTSPTMLRLAALWLEGAAVALEVQGPVAVVDTWYVRHGEDQVPACYLSRLVELDSDMGSWEESILQAWWDHFDPHRSHLLHIVTPPPRADPLRRVVAHVIIEQMPCPELVAVMISQVVAASVGLAPKNHVRSLAVDWQRESFLRDYFPVVAPSVIMDLNLMRLTHLHHEVPVEGLFRLRSGDILEILNGHGTPGVGHALMDVLSPPTTWSYHTTFRISIMVCFLWLGMWSTLVLLGIFQARLERGRRVSWMSLRGTLITTVICRALVIAGSDSLCRGHSGLQLCQLFGMILWIGPLRWSLAWFDLILLWRLASIPALMSLCGRSRLVIVELHSSPLKIVVSGL